MSNTISIHHVIATAIAICLIEFAPARAEFIHPGISHTQTSIDFVKTKIAAGEEPWASAWKAEQSSRYAALAWRPEPRSHVERGPYNDPNIGSSEFSADASASYRHALVWALTGREDHANKSAEILNAWSGELKSVSNHDAKLLVGMEGYEYCNAAELLKHTWDGWPQDDQARFEKMLREIFYPIIQDFYPSANGNWDASMLQTMLAMGVYLDDQAMFDRAIDYYRNGKGNGAVRNYFKPSGQCQESGRDQAHTQMGLDFLACTCEIAWNQGVDLYGAYDNRLLKGFEYTAKYNLGFDVPFEPYRSFEGRYHYKSISDKSRGRLRPMYEKVLSHYANRKGLDTEFTRRAVMKLREGKERESRRRRRSSLGTLMFAATQAAAALEDSSDEPAVLGRGVGLFRVGKLLAQDDFANLDNWAIQVQEKSGFDPAHVEAHENSLDCLLPGRGCTIWFKKKLPTRVTITYDVICPTPKLPIKGVQPRDINNFWMATDPEAPDQGLFDPARYNGAFGDYDKMLGYYASTGGGTAKAANRTTRMRRYPRKVDGQPAAHIALNDKDEKAGYLITPDKVMSVQLVAYDDVIQYIVDGNLIYQIAGGDQIQVEGPDDKGDVVRKDGTYDLKRFPVYREGFFGFRMVGTHHIYRNFRVHALEPHDTDARGIIRVSTVDELRSAMEGSDQRIVMKAGKYEIGSESLRLSGDNNHVDLTDAYFCCEVSQAGSSRMNITGHGNTIRNGEFEDVYYNGMKKVTDFTAYNKDRKRLANGGGTNIRIKGNNNHIVGLKVTVRGSYPYGYGAMFGIGRTHSFKLSKHAGILITGKNTVLDGVEVYQQAFCHGIYMQKPADNTVIKNSLVEGVVRPTNEMYAETDPESLPAKYDYQMPFSIVGSKNDPGTPIPKDHMFTLTEDGIRVYRDGGSVRVENTTVKKTRGGIRTYLGSGATISNCTAIDCGSTNFNLPRGGTIKSSRGNFAYGPLSDFRLGKSNQNIELTILPSPNAMGDHNIADIQGDNHTIVFHRSPGPHDKTTRAIVVTGSDSTIRNETEYSIVLEPSASGNSVVSFGPVTDRGKDNKVSRIESDLVPTDLRAR